MPTQFRSGFVFREIPAYLRFITIAADTPGVHLFPHNPNLGNTSVKALLG
jgi:hypothetical protein